MTGGDKDVAAIRRSLSAFRLEKRVQSARNAAARLGGVLVGLGLWRLLRTSPMDHGTEQYDVNVERFQVELAAGLLLLAFAWSAKKYTVSALGVAIAVVGFLWTGALAVVAVNKEAVPFFVIHTIVLAYLLRGFLAALSLALSRAAHGEE